MAVKYILPFKTGRMRMRLFFFAEKCYTKLIPNSREIEDDDRI